MESPELRAQSPAPWVAKVESRLAAPSVVSRFPWRKLTVLGAALAGAAAILFWFDPAAGGFYPVCLFYRTTGWKCPGCGGLRAAHQLLHGHLVAAFDLNPLVPFGALIAMTLGIRWAVRRFRSQTTAWTLRPGWLWAGLVLLLAFSIGRNF